MAKEAGVRLTLNSSVFTAGLRNVEKDAAGSGDRMGKAISSGMKAGLKGADDAVKGLFSSVKSGLTALTGIGGIMGTVDLMKQAYAAEGQFKKLTFQIRAGTGASVDFRDLMGDATGSAVKWGKDVNDLGRAMTNVFEETGSVAATRGTIDVIATTARAAKEPVEMLGTVTGVLSKKFGIANEDVGETLASILSLGNKGGITVEELSGKIGYIGAVAREAGLTGTGGFNKMIGLMNLADEGSKNMRKSLSMVSGLLDTLGVKAERDKTLMKLGIDPSGVKGGVDSTIGSILKQTGGSKDKLAVAFGGEQLAFMVDVGKKYSTAFDATAGTVKEKTAAGLAAYDAALAKASKSELTYADVQAQAAKGMEGAQGKMDAAVQKMREAFMRPEVANAMSKLADVMPQLADAVASFVSFAAEHPVLAGAGVVGGVAAKGFATAGLEAAIGAAFARGGGTAAAAIATGVGETAPGLVSALAAGGAGLAGSFGIALLGAGIVAAFVYAIGSALKDANDEREKNKALDAAHDKNEGATEGDGAEGGNSGANPLTLGNERDEHGNWKILEGQEALDQRAMVAEKMDEWRKTRAEEESQAAGRAFIGNDPTTPDEARAWYAPTKQTSGGAAQSPENAKLLADMLRSSPLNVKITNPEALRGGPGGGGLGGPGGGYGDGGSDG